MSQEAPRDDSAEQPAGAPPPSADAPTPAAPAEPDAAPAAHQQRSTLIRQLILVGLLALMLFALWYDYKVARPRVETAYKTIEELNLKMNSQSRTRATENTDVHEALQRKPSRTFNEGPYQVEVFSWVSGLPFRTHDLYAVYSPRGGKRIFMRQYKFELPLDELHPEDAAKLAAQGSEGGEGEDEAPSMGPEMMGPGDPGGEGGGGGRRGGRGEGGPPPGDTPQRPPFDDADPAGDSDQPSDRPAEADADETPPAPADAPPADAPPADDAPPAAEPAGEPPAEAAAEETPADDTADDDESTTDAP